MSHQWTILILGASGDLSRRKLIPAMYDLIRHHKEWSIRFFGAAKDAITAEKLILDSAKYIPHRDPELLQRFCAQSSYQQLSFESQEDFIQLADALNKFENSQQVNRLIYLAAPSDYFCIITENLTAAGIIHKQQPHEKPVQRIVYEKPFGADASTAKKINTCITRLLNESQMWRIDHFLAKTLIRTIPSLKEGNIIFDTIWSNQYIQQVHIELLETLSVETRSKFYDQYGALKDVVQNHMLHMLALIATRLKLTGPRETACKAKADTIRHIIPTRGILGQYRGYRTCPGVPDNSRTETYALLECFIRRPEWHGVPFYLKTGKMLKTQSTNISIIFKPVAVTDPNQTYPPNILRISIDPHAHLELEVYSRKPNGLTEKMPLNFCYSCAHGYQWQQPYEVILKEVITDRRAACVDFGEIDAAWGFMDLLHTLDMPLYTYEPNSEGPPEAASFITPLDI